jgi:hypothetical protein
VRIGVPSRHVQLTRCFLSELGVCVRQSRQAHACYARRKVPRIDAPEPPKPNQAHIQLHLFLPDVFLATASYAFFTPIEAAKPFHF